MNHDLFEYKAPGVWYYPVLNPQYDQAYFDKYCEYAKTTMGKKLTEFRRDFVLRHWHGPLIDIGVGCGQFLEAMPKAEGFDVNNASLRWLHERNRFRDAYHGVSEAMSFWDSLEHIGSPWVLLSKVRFWAFVSMPIYFSWDHLISSRHFRPDEHYWYFTFNGFVSFMQDRGFELREYSEMESVLGREDISTFAFERERVEDHGPKYPWPA